MYLGSTFCSALLGQYSLIDVYQKPIQQAVVQCDSLYLLTDFYGNVHIPNSAFPCTIKKEGYVVTVLDSIPKNTTIFLEEKKNPFYLQTAANLEEWVPIFTTPTPFHQNLYLGSRLGFRESNPHTVQWESMYFKNNGFDSQIPMQVGVYKSVERGMYRNSPQYYQLTNWSQQPQWQWRTSFSTTDAPFRIDLNYRTAESKRGWSYAAWAMKKWGNSLLWEGRATDSYGFLMSSRYRKRNILWDIQLGYSPQNNSTTSLLTQEQMELTSTRYSPLWGEQNNQKRYSNIRSQKTPFVHISWQKETEKHFFKIGLVSSWSDSYLSSIQRMNTPNEQPFYYTNLPSSYTDSVVISELQSRWQNNPLQIDWDDLYFRNQNNFQTIQNASGSGGEYNGNRAKYILAKRNTTATENQLVAQWQHAWNPHWRWRQELFVAHQYSRQNKSVYDLLGADFWLDIQPLVAYQLGELHPMAQSNLVQPNKIALEGDVIDYNYTLQQYHAHFSSELNYTKKQHQLRLLTKIYHRNSIRKGKFKSGIFSTNSLGSSKFEQWFYDAQMEWERRDEKTSLGVQIAHSKLPINTNVIFPWIKYSNFQNTTISPEQITRFQAHFSYKFKKMNYLSVAEYAFSNNANRSQTSFLLPQFSGFTDAFSVNSILYQGKTMSWSWKQHLNINWSNRLSTQVETRWNYAKWTNNPQIQSYANDGGLLLAENSESNIKNYPLIRQPQFSIGVQTQYRRKTWQASAEVYASWDNFVEVNPLNRVSSFFWNNQVDNSTNLIQKLPMGFQTQLRLSKFWKWNKKTLRCTFLIENITNYTFNYSYAREQFGWDSNLGFNPLFNPMAPRNFQLQISYQL